MKFQKGQVVKVRDDLYTMGIDGVFNLWTDMCSFAGDKVVIAEARETQWGDRYEIVGSPRCWTEECFAEVQKVREVHRPAEVGEWIKIVKAHTTYGNYDNGEIHKVTGYCNKAYGEVYIKNLTDGYIGRDEYVVLENYQPEYKVDWSRVSNREISEELLRRFS